MSGRLATLRAERAASVDTLRRVGPDAPTLCGDWTAADVAAHLRLQDQGRGVPILLTAPLGLALLRAGVRLPSSFAARMEARHEEVLETPWDELCDRLATGPPAAVALPVFWALRLHENWIHHEDVRRADGSGPRPSDDVVGDALWAALAWYGAYQRKVLAGVDLVVRRSDAGGAERRLGDASGERVTVTGPPGEIALVVAGRARASHADIEGPDEAVARLTGPGVTM